MKTPQNLALLCLTLPALTSAEVRFHVQPPEPALTLEVNPRDCSWLAGRERMLCQSGKAAGNEFVPQPHRPGFTVIIQAKDCSRLSGTERMLCQSGKFSSDDCHALQNAHERNQCLLSMGDRPPASTSARDPVTASAPKAPFLHVNPGQPGDLPPQTDLETRLLPPAP